MRALWHIGKNTFRESLRQPIYLLLLMTALVLVGIYPGTALFVFREQAKLITDGALATMLVFGWVLAVLCASHAISREIETGTVLMVLSKPVNRVLFVVSKVAGILLALAIFCYLVGVAALLALRVSRAEFKLDLAVMGLYFGALAVSSVFGAWRNYSRGRSFCMATVAALLVVMTVVLGVAQLLSLPSGTPEIRWEIVPALVLVGFAVWALGSLATALSTRLALVGNLMICLVVFVLGLMSRYLLGQHAAENWFFSVAYAAVPDWQLFWMADALAADKSIPVAYVALGAVYIFFLVVFFVVLGVVLFSGREVGRQTQV